MADRPILFSAPMVRALLDGRKTQTRRIAKFIEPSGEQFHIHGAAGGWFGPEARVAEVAADYAPFSVGDRLWVKETHACVGDADRWTLYRASGYEAECDRHGFDKPYPAESEIKWKPSIFMRRALSRLTLTVTDVRVERLKDCSEKDAQAEGLQRKIEGFFPLWRGAEGLYWRCYRVMAYADLWNSINGAGAWDANPWVVAVSFDVREGNIDG
jgi:hypothetical protein